MTLETITEYPFKDTIKIKLDLEHSARFELRLRVPAWCEQPQLSINGETFDSETRSASRSSQGFIHLEREWQAHDEITLVLPMTVRKLERPLGALSLALGPLVLALWPGEIWYQIPATVPVPPAGATWTPEGFGDWEVKNRRPWNYALEIASDTDAAQCQVERFDVTSPPFSVHGTRPDARVARAPLKVFVPARRLLEWTLDTRGYSASIPPQSPVSSLQPTFIMEFVPYGCARLRTAEFPRLESKPSHSER